MLRRVARRAEPHVRANPVVDMVVDVVVVHANHVRCIRQFVPTVAMRPRYLSSHEATSPFIAVIATNPRRLAVVVIADRAGNRHE